MGTSIRLGRIWGIPLGVNYSWFIVLGLIVFLLSTRFSDEFPQWARVERWMVAIVTALLFFGSVLAHELAHSVVARWRGIPVKGITLFIFGGVSQIAREASRPRLELAIAIVGPLSSLALGGLFLGVALLTRSHSEVLYAVSAVLFQTNVALGVFNLVPGFPLDGGRVLRALVWGFTGNHCIATRIAVLSGQGVAGVLFLGGVALAVVQNDLSGLWLSFIGLFLYSAASTSHRQARVLEGLRGSLARDVMSTDFALVPSVMSLKSVVEEYLLRGVCVVDDGVGPLGVLQLRDLRRIPRSQWALVSVAQVMRPLEEAVMVGPETEAETVLELLDEGDGGPAIVARGDQILGLISREGLLRFAQVRRELGI